MKLKTLHKSVGEYNKLLNMIFEAHNDGLGIVAVTSDFEPTQVVGEARWLACGNYHEPHLIMIDGVGDMITIIPE